MKEIMTVKCKDHTELRITTPEGHEIKGVRELVLVEDSGGISVRLNIEPGKVEAVAELVKEVVDDSRSS